MELETRLIVLEYALNTEKTIHTLLESYLNIDTTKRKALTNKSGGLAFKNKIDLLHDIEILSVDGKSGDTDHLNPVQTDHPKLTALCLH